jgi:formylglycine-generating enzyme required for sulfatase activity
MVMRFVPPGEFAMGTTGGKGDAEPIHTVVLHGFWIDQTEVSNAQYRACVEAGACAKPAACGGNWVWADEQETLNNNPDQPVVCATWEQAQVYGSWVGGRLPTEAEWEYAARGPEGRAYPWGDEFDGTRLNYCEASCPLDSRDTRFDDGFGHPAPVGSFPEGASWCGALDMAGNVEEWVADWYGAYPGERQLDPTGPPSGTYRVLRGGSWAYSALYAGCTFRRYAHPVNFRNGHGIGFRIVVPMGE